MLAEQYKQEPTQVASIVLIGNMAAIVWIPLALALAPLFSRWANLKVFKISSWIDFTSGSNIPVTNDSLRINFIGPT